MKCNSVTLQSGLVDDTYFNPSLEPREHGTKDGKARMNFDYKCWFNMATFIFIYTHIPTWGV